MRSVIAASVAALLLLAGGARADEPSEEQGGQGALSSEPAQSTEPEVRTAPGAIEEILITARKREEGSQSVPISISAFTGAELDEAQTHNIYRIAELTPNLEVRYVLANSRPAIYIRGIGTSDFGAAAASPVSIYKDGVLMSLQTGSLFQTFDLDRTEVLRGPQGTLYGKNTTGGTINLHSVMPSDELEGYLQASYGNYKTNNFEGAVNLPINEQLAARVSFARRKSDGYIDNHGPGHDDFDGNDNWAFRTLLSYTPTENLRLLLNVHGERLDSDFMYVPRGLFDPATVDGRSFFGEPCPTSIFQGGCADLQGHVGGGEKSPYDTQSAVGGFERQDLFGTSLTADLDVDTRWGPVTLTSITAYEYVSESGFEDVDGGPNLGLHAPFGGSSWQFTQELRAASAGDGPLQWLAGAWFFRSQIKNRIQFLFPPDGAIGGDFGFWSNSRGNDNIDAENYAFFGEASYDLTERLTLTAGLRYSWERKQSRQSEHRYIEYSDTPELATAQGTPCGPDPDIHFDPANCGPGRDDSESWAAVSGNFVLDYQLTDDIMLYASYRRGFKSGGFSAALTTCEVTCAGSPLAGLFMDGTRGDGTDLDTTFDEEILQSYEAGIKSMWFDRRLRFNLSTFFYDYDDLQVFTLELVGGQIVTVTENAADATIWGGEIDMMARPLPGLEIRAAGAWLSTEYKDYVSATLEGDLSGNELIAAPNYTGSGSISYELNLRGGVLRGQVGASYSDEVFYLADNIKRARQGPVWLVNGNLSYLLPDERTEISVWVRNWNDKVYITNFFDISGLGYDQMGSSRPRTYGVTVRYSF